MTWTTEKIMALAALWTKGETASAIARALGGVTRNAVIGKAHRLQLPARPPRPSSSASKPRRSTHLRSRAPTHARTHGRVSSCAAPTPIPSLTDPPATKVTTATLSAEHCHWPEGDPRCSAFHYCGRVVLPGSRYCPHHHGRAYQKKARPLFKFMD